VFTRKKSYRSAVFAKEFAAAITFGGAIHAGCVDCTVGAMNNIFVGFLAIVAV